MALIKKDDDFVEARLELNIRRFNISSSFRSSILSKRLFVITSKLIRKLQQIYRSIGNKWI